VTFRIALAAQSQAKRDIIVHRSIEQYWLLKHGGNPGGAPSNRLAR